jgi:hypothetical protein
MSHSTPTGSSTRSEAPDAVLISGVLVFAFLVASTVESNGVLWAHLAAGRRLAQDAFSVQALLSPPGVFDRCLYALYGGVGGAGVLVLKALAIAVLAWLLLPPRVGGANAVPLAVGTLLALLALTPYLALRPVLLSYFFCVATLRLLLVPPGERTWKRYALGGLLFVLWVNLDSWFWLGPLLGILFWLGEGKGRWRRWWLPGAGVLVCLLNPRGLYVFVPPPGWLPQPWWSASPWRGERLEAMVQRFDLTALAYPVLLGLGLLSLVLPGVGQRGSRALAWTGLAILSSWQTALVPFFALVAGPILALNCQEAFYPSAISLPEGNKARPALLSVLLRGALLTVSILLIFLAAIGGLQGVPRTGSVPGWGIEADPSSRQFVSVIERWRRRGWLHPNDRLLTVPPELVPYFAWFTPEEPLAPGPPQDLAALEADCRAGKGNLAAVDDRNLFRQLASAAERWLLLHIEGRFTLWGWKESCTDLARHPPFAANRLAFAPNDEDHLLLPPLPSWQDAGVSPSVLDWSWPSRTPAGRDSEMAAAYLRYFQAGVLPPYQRRWLQGWSAYAASLAMPPPPAALSLLLRLEQPPWYLRDIDQDLPALPLLAVRAARWALAVDANDAHAYLRLGQAYRTLWETAGERLRCRDASLFAHLRYTQAAAALEQAVRLAPDLEAAHRLLVGLYLEQGYLDAALDHRRHEVRLARRAGPQQEEDQQAFARRLERLEHQTRALEAEVAERQKALAALPASVTQPRERALAAVRLGLAQQALDEILVPASPILLESSGVNLELELMLRLGRLEALHEWMQGKELETYGANLGLHNLPAPPLPGYPLAYRLPAAPWFRFSWAAARGDYDLAQGQLRELFLQLEETRQQQLRSLRRSLALTITDEALLSVQPQLLLLRLLGHKDRLTATQMLAPLASFQGDRADLHVLRGLLSLERGWTQQAQMDFEAALRLGQGRTNDVANFAARPLAEFYLQRLYTAPERVP